MADHGKDENVVKNGFSTSADSIDVPLKTDSNETSVSDLPSSSVYGPIDTTQSKSPSSPTSYSQGTASDLNLDVITPVIPSESISSDVKKTRFTVQRMASSELQNLSFSSGSSTKADNSPTQSPKSVETVEPCTSSQTIAQVHSTEVPHLLDATIVVSKIGHPAEPDDLITPQSQDSFPIKEEIELPQIHRGIGSSSNRLSSSDDEDIDVGDRSNLPLLTDDDDSPANRAKSLKKLDVRFADGQVKTVSIEDLPQSTSATSSPSNGTSNRNRNGGPFSQQCITTCSIGYIALVCTFVILTLVLYIIYSVYGVMSKTRNAANLQNNHTSNGSGLAMIQLEKGIAKFNQTELYNFTDTTTVDPTFVESTNATEMTTTTTNTTEMTTTTTNAPIIDTPEFRPTTAITDAPITYAPNITGTTTKPSLAN